MIGFLRKASKRQKVIWAAGAGLVLITGILILSKGNGHSGEIVTVKRGTISQVVSVTGKTQAVSNVDLSFDKSGRVVNLPVKVGDRVVQGQILASLDSNELKAQLSDTLANVEVQKAELDELLVGSRPEDIKIRESELEKDEQDLDNLYSGALNVASDAFNKADDALRKQLDPLFNNDEQNNPSLTFDVNSSQLKTDIEAKRLGLGLELKDFGKKISSVSSESAQVDALLTAGISYFNKLQNFLNDVFQAVAYAPTLPASTAEIYKANINTARGNVNTGLTSLSDRVQDISAQKIVVQKSRFSLELERAGATKEQLAAQMAQVKQAEAKAEVIQAQIRQNSIFAPFPGLVAKQDLEIGEVAAANQNFISLISDDNLEVEANVPEVSIGKVAVGNSAKVKLDAFSEEIFDAKVIYVEPAETLIEGVVNYKIKVLFDKPDQRIRSGLTADIDIVTFTKDNVLTIPAYALILQPDGALAVELKERGRTRIVSVEVGARSSNGEVEILSGLEEGDELLASLE